MTLDDALDDYWRRIREACAAFEQLPVSEQRRAHLRMLREAVTHRDPEPQAAEPDAMTPLRFRGTMVPERREWLLRAAADLELAVSIEDDGTVCVWLETAEQAYRLGVRDASYAVSTSLTHWPGRT